MNSFSLVGCMKEAYLSEVCGMYAVRCGLHSRTRPSPTQHQRWASVIWTMDDSLPLQISDFKIHVGPVRLTNCDNFDYDIFDISPERSRAFNILLNNIGGW